VLGIDPGATTGWSVHDLKSEQLWGYGTVTHAKLNIDTINSYLEIFNLYEDIRYLAIEKQYLSKKPKSLNPESLIKIVEIRTLMTVLAIQRGCTVVDIHPTKWITKLLGMPTSRGRKDIKQASKKTVKLLYGLDVKQDIADAILIGRFAVGHIKFENFTSSNTVVYAGA
jgi:Holliday junction resolvasome RuvABC endonuclease subunit